LRTAVMLCSLMVLTGESFSELTRDIYFYKPFSVSIKVPAASLEKYKKDRVIASAVKDAEKELDGEGEILLKSSEKDSTISVLAYGSDYEHISELALEISKVIKDRYIK
ncbi:MAG: hypothetical protein IJL87_05290, partial [Clostridia bacterium]|nr:hypothetical protein [Clostridia bacterium]